MSIFEYNGSAIVAMAGLVHHLIHDLIPPDRFSPMLDSLHHAGKECVAIGSDLRFGVQLQTITTDRPKVHKIHDKLWLGLSGLSSDTETLYEKLVFRHNLYKLREERNMKPVTFGHMVSSALYERRFGPYFAAPVIAGLDESGVPYLCGMDTIGAMETAKDFMLSGTAPESLYGKLESLTPIGSDQ